ncbi:MAG: V-type ATP synthase subunit K, partial [archaeon]
GQGIAAAAGAAATADKPHMFGKSMVFSVLPETQAIYGLLVAILILFFTGIIGGGVSALPTAAGLAAVGAGIAVGIAGLSAIGQGIVASSGIAVTSEKPSLFGKSMIFSVLPETQAIYGLLIAILIMFFTGIIGSSYIPDMPIPVGIAAIGAGMAIGFAGLSAIGQGIAAAAGAGATANKPQMFGKSMVFSVLPETQAIYGLLVAILILFFTGILGGGIKAIPAAAGLAAVGAGIAVGFAGISAIGQGIAAAAGIGVTSEKPSLFGKSMIFSVLPETQAIYGLLIAILIMFFTGLIGGKFIPDMPLVIGIAAVGAGMAIGFAGSSAVGQGIAAASGAAATAEKQNMFGKSMVFSVLPETQAIYGLLVAILILFFTGILGGTFNQVTGAAALAAVGAGLAVGIAGLSAIGQGIATAAGAGATSSDPSLFGKSMVFSVLPETQAIYGLLVAIMLLYFTGILSGTVTELPLSAGIAAVGAGLVVGFAGLSAIGQGIVAASGIMSMSRRPESFGKSLILAVMPETFAILGLLAAILIMLKVGLMGG